MDMNQPDTIYTTVPMPIKEAESLYDAAKDIAEVWSAYTRIAHSDYAIVTIVVDDVNAPEFIEYGEDDLEFLLNRFEKTDFIAYEPFVWGKDTYRAIDLERSRLLVPDVPRLSKTERWQFERCQSVMSKLRKLLKPYGASGVLETVQLLIDRLEKKQTNE